MKIAAVIAHYSDDGLLSVDLFHLVLELAKLNIEVIFVSTNLMPSEEEKILPYSKVLVRENFGYDFWSYKLGISCIQDKSTLDGILLINSSIIILDAAKLLEKFLTSMPQEACLYGLTISNEIQKHIQSYCVFFNGRELIASAAFDLWWSQMTPISNYKDVIMKYEIGMSDFFTKAGFNIYSLLNISTHDKILAACRAIADKHFLLDKNYNQHPAKSGFTIEFDLASKINPTSILWDKILHDYHYIKVKILTKDINDFRPIEISRYMENNFDKIEIIKEIFESRGVLSMPIYGKALGC